MKLRTKLKRAKEENEWLRGQLLMQYMNPGKVCCFDRKRVERVERVKLRNVRRIRTDDLPPADVAPVVRGRWIERNPQDSKTCRLIECSECGHAYIVGFNVPYEDWTEGRAFCSRCGAKMDMEEAIYDHNAGSI